MKKTAKNRSNGKEDLEPEYRSRLSQGKAQPLCGKMRGWKSGRCTRRRRCSCVYHAGVGQCSASRLGKNDATNDMPDRINQRRCPVAPQFEQDSSEAKNSSRAHHNPAAPDRCGHPAESQKTACGRM